VVVPTASTAADMDRTWPTLDLAASLGTPAVVLLARIRTGTRSLAATVQALADEKVTVLDTRIPQREALAIAWGQTVMKNAYGYDLTAQQIKELLEPWSTPSTSSRTCRD
nr:hypothetical protein [Actinomycetota bacterium]